MALAERTVGIAGTVGTTPRLTWGNRATVGTGSVRLSGAGTSIATAIGAVAVARRLSFERIGAIGAGLMGATTVDLRPGRSLVADVGLLGAVRP